MTRAELALLVAAGKHLTAEGVSTRATLDDAAAALAVTEALAVPLVAHLAHGRARADVPLDVERIATERAAAGRGRRSRASGAAQPPRRGTRVGARGAVASDGRAK